MKPGPSNLPGYFLDFDAPEAEEAVELLEMHDEIHETPEAQALYNALEAGDGELSQPLAAAKALIDG